MKTINTDTWVWVRLTPEGKHKLSERVGMGYQEVNGWSKWRLWVLMATFGDYFRAGRRRPFEPEISLVDPAGKEQEAIQCLVGRRHPSEIELPKNLEACLVKIRHQTCNGLSEWHETCFYDPEKAVWMGYHGGTTFEDGEQVIAWVRCSDVKLNQLVKLL